MKRMCYLLAVMLFVAGCEDDKPEVPSGLVYTPSIYKVVEDAGFTSSAPVVAGSRPFRFYLGENAPAGFSVDVNTGVIGLTGGHSLKTGKYTLDVVVENSANRVTFTSAIRVETGDINDVGGIAVPFNLTYPAAPYEADERGSFESAAPTVEGDGPYSFSLAGDFGNFAIDPALGVISLYADNSLPMGNYPLDVMVTNKAKTVLFEDAVTVTIVPPLPGLLAGKGYTMVWNDEFDGAELDMTKWNYRYENSKRGYATVSRDNVRLDGNGYLAVKITEVDGAYYIGMIGTNGIYETTYGYFECRARMQKSVGPHTSFWLQSPRYGKTDNPAVDGAEIDVFEYLRNYPSTIYHTIHWNAYNSPSYKKNAQAVRRTNIVEGFHTFGVEWTEAGYSFYINGERTKTITDGISKRDQYMVLTSSLNSWGGGGDGKNVETATTIDRWNFPDEVVFDYVRVFQQR